MSKRKSAAGSKGRSNPLGELQDFASSLKCIRFAGVALGGGKAERTSVVILEYYPEYKKVFLRKVFEKIRSDADSTADQMILEILKNENEDLESITFDTPLSLPVCLNCRCGASGYENCPFPEVQWMWDVFHSRERAKRPNKMFTPYTERAAEIYIANFLEEPFHPHHALGANMAPLTARAIYLKQRLKTPVYESFPKLTLWRVGRALKVPKSHLRFHRHSGEGDESRMYLLKSLIEKGIAFVYQQDVRILVENWYAFEAFLCAVTGFLQYRGQCEPRPQNFPKDSSWLSFPSERIEWFE